MVDKCAQHLAVLRRRVFIVVATSVAPLALLGGASPALATEHHPTGDFTPFFDCPLSNTTVEQCVVANTTGGEFTIGARTVPITNTVTLQGGTRENEGVTEFFGAEDGKTLSKTEQPVPGGLLGVVAPAILPKFLREIVNKLVSEGLAGVTATTELAKPAKEIGINTVNLLSEEGVALALPVKVKLNNTFLGSECYIGSSASPLSLNLTTGTTAPLKPNEPIKGTKGTVTFKDEFNYVLITGSSLVDNAFSAPAATGCGGLLAFLIDPAVNAELALPAGKGHNTAILNGTLEDGSAEATLASE